MRSNPRPVVETSQVTISKDRKGHKIINQYTIIKKIGEGAYATVKLCKARDDFYAMKVFKKDMLMRRRDFSNSADGRMVVTNALTDVYKEIDLMKELNHPNVIRMYEIIDDVEGEKIYMILDYCERGSLMDWNSNEHRFITPWTNKEISESQLKSIFRQLVLAVRYLHINHIIHRDIKPQNVLLTSKNHVKLADFGQASKFEGENDNIRKTQGTYHFLAPESITDIEHCSGRAADIWAVGVTLYIAVFNILPFSGSSISEIMNSIENDDLIIPNIRPISADLRNLILHVLDKNPRTRVTIEGLLVDPWLNSEGQPLMSLI
ncbi:unnamed protein product [Blepharisma stoltei]|uniref:Protein kinase domain-containing protein n=1 Tax=Blepharisma stoltei TaxID=1481888 RepID=A0AAU9J9X2_9CILI|nr:unnamed protein product [Blepharisma stoltei]